MAARCSHNTAVYVPSVDKMRCLDCGKYVVRVGKTRWWDALVREECRTADRKAVRTLSGWFR